MELFARFSYQYPLGYEGIKNDAAINKILNDKLLKFIEENSIEEYRILNAEIHGLPHADVGIGTGSVICTLNIAYKKLEGN
jgi:hypothetical protein